MFVPLLLPPQQRPCPQPTSHRAGASSAETLGRAPSWSYLECGKEGSGKRPCKLTRTFTYPFASHVNGGGCTVQRICGNRRGPLAAGRVLRCRVARQHAAARLPVTSTAATEIVCIWWWRFVYTNACFAKQCLHVVPAHAATQVKCFRSAVVSGNAHGSSYLFVSFALCDANPSIRACPTLLCRTPAVWCQTAFSQQSGLCD